MLRIQLIQVVQMCKIQQEIQQRVPTLTTPYDLMKKCTDMNDETKAIEEEKHRFIRLYGGF